MATTTEPVAEAGLPPETRRALTALIVGGMAAVLDTTIVAIALQSLVTQLHASIATIQWVSTGYLLSLAAVIPLVGWAQARFGGKRLWMFALGLFALGSVLCAGAWNAESLVGFRVVQGLGAGMLFPLMTTLAMQAARSSGGNAAMGRTVAMVSLPIAVGPILGPVLGGIILNWLDWRWLFLVNVPVCAVGLVLARRRLPADPPRPVAARPRLDLPGLALVVPALVGILLGLTNVHEDGGFDRTDVRFPLAAGVLLLAGFVGWALRRRAAALVDVRLLAVRSVGASSVVLFLSGACMYAAMFLLPLYWQELRGFDVLAAALLLIPQGVGSLLTRVLAGRLTDTIGARGVAVVGFLLVALTTVPFALAGGSTAQWWLGLVLFARGLGLGAVLIPVMTSAYLDLEPDAVPHASMITRVAQQLGGSFGVAIVAVVLQGAAESGGGARAGFDRAFWWTVGFTVLAAALSLLLPNRPATGAVPA